MEQSSPSHPTQTMLGKKKSLLPLRWDRTFIRSSWRRQLPGSGEKYLLAACWDYPSVVFDCSHKGDMVKGDDRRRLCSSGVRSEWIKRRKKVWSWLTLLEHSHWSPFELFSVPCLYESVECDTCEYFFFLFCDDYCIWYFEYYGSSRYDWFCNPLPCGSYSWQSDCWQTDEGNRYSGLVVFRCRLTTNNSSFRWYWFLFVPCQLS